MIFTRIKIVSFYCLPVILALMVVLNSYRSRVEKVADIIVSVHHDVLLDPQNPVLQAPSDEKMSGSKGLLFEYFSRHAQPLQKLRKGADDLQNNANANLASRSNLTPGLLDSPKQIIHRKLNKIWLSNALTVLSMTLLPYVLMGLVLSNSQKIAQSSERRLRIAKQNAVMKFLLGCAIAMGWVYFLNPDGRGASTIDYYLTAVDFFREHTLPTYVDGVLMKPVLAGFFGWYLHGLGYIFAKLVRHDVISSNVYGHLFKKLLFVYGIAIILPSAELVPDEKVALALFLLGFFPLTAFSMLKEQVSKLVTSQRNEGYLTILPGISRWQILRLEEEGVDTMADLAMFNKEEICESVPDISQIINYWIDIARLYVVVGHENYLVLKKHCSTASSFISRADDPGFSGFVEENNLGNASEISNNLQRTFSITKADSL